MLSASLNKSFLSFSLFQYAGVEAFKSFLENTSGLHLLNFWLDCEFYKDMMEDENEVSCVEQRNILFRSDLGITAYVFVLGASCSSVVECYGSLDRSLMVDPLSYSRSSQCSMSGVTKAVVCAILSAGWCI